MRLAHMASVEIKRINNYGVKYINFKNYHLHSRSVEFSELERVHVVNGGFGGVDGTFFSGLFRDTLGVDLLALLLGSHLLGVVLAHALLEGLAALRLADVLNAHVDALGTDAATNSFVHDDAARVLGDIENFTSLSLVVLVGHTLLNGAVSHDVNEVTHSVVGQEAGQGGVLAVLAVGAGEQVTGASAISKSVRHLYLPFLIFNNTYI